MNRESYDAIAGEWDEARAGFVRREREYLDALLAGLEGGRVLDLGCGTGRPMAGYVLRRGHRVVGVDQSEELLKIASRRFPEATWICGRIEEGAWVGAYDAVILWDALFHIERCHHRRILERVRDSLRPGGRVMLTAGGSAQPPFTDTMFGREFYYDSFPPDELMALLSGLELAPLIHEFMERPTGGRNKGRYAIVAEKEEVGSAGDPEAEQRTGGAMHERDRGAAEALAWIIGVLNHHQVPYQVVGGLAARAYGACRPLVDLDLYIPEEGFGRILPEVRDHLRRGPAQHTDAHWDLTFARIEYAGWKIELGAAEGARIHDARAGRWVDQGIDFSRPTWTTVLGQRVATIPREDLVAYKSLLDREVDRRDLAEIGGGHDLAAES